MWLKALTISPTSKHTSFIFSKQGFITQLLNIPAKPLESVPVAANNQNNLRRKKKQHNSTSELGIKASNFEDFISYFSTSTLASSSH